MEPIKNAKANEFLAQADVLAREIADPAVTLTGEELKQKVEGIAALKQRAQAVADLTPERVAESRGLVPIDASPSEDVVGEPTYAEASEAAVKAFGSVGRYVLAQAKEGTKFAKPWTPAQRKAHALLQRVIVGTASDASGGEFLLPLTQAPDIFVGAAIVQPGLFERAPKYACPGRSVRIPYLVQDDVDPHTRPLSGISATAIEAEGGEKDEKEPVLAQRVVTAYKYAAYTEAGDEVLEDDYTGQLPQVLQRAVGGDLINSANAHVTRTGTGSGQPLGALHASNGALITINRNTSQSVDVDDILRMLARSTMGPGTFWIASPSLIPEIYALALTSGSQVTFLNNLRDAAGAQLFGMPLVWSHLMSQKGVAGDLGLIDPGQYAAVLRRQVTMESSIHYKFRNDITAYRFFCRMGGAPIPSSEYSFSATGGVADYAFSGFVRLGDDATS